MRRGKLPQLLGGRLAMPHGGEAGGGACGELGEPGAELLDKAEVRRPEGEGERGKGHAARNDRGIDIVKSAVAHRRNQRLGVPRATKLRTSSKVPKCVVI